MAARRKVGWWRQVALLVLFLGLTVLVILEFTSARAFGNALASAAWGWIAVSAVLFGASFYLWAVLYRVGFQAVGVSFGATRLLAPLMVSIFLNTAAPVGEALFVEYARERGRSTARTAAGVILVLVVDLATTLPFVVGGLAYIGARGKLPSYDLVVTALFVLVILLLVAALWLAKVRRGWLEAGLRWAQRLVNRLARLLRRREWVSPSWASRNAEQFSAASGSMVAHPGLLLKATGWGLLFHAVNAAGLYTLFLAFHQQVAPGTVAAGFGMSIVLYVIAVTPQGVGATESVMSLLFSSMGVPTATAVVVAVTYRVFNVWIPLLVGYLFARRMAIFGGAPQADVEGAGGAD